MNPNQCNVYGCVDTIRRYGITRPMGGERYRLTGMCGHCTEKASEEGRTLIDWGSQQEAALSVAVLGEAWVNHVGQEGMTTVEIADDLSVERPYATAIKTSLSEGGYMERFRVLTLKPRGVALCRAMGMVGEVAP